LVSVVYPIQCGHIVSTTLRRANANNTRLPCAADLAWNSSRHADDPLSTHARSVDATAP